MKKLLLTFNILFAFTLLAVVLPKVRVGAVGEPCNNCTSNAGVCSVRSCSGTEVCSISSACPTTCSSLPDYGDGAGVGTCQPAGGTPTPTATPTLTPPPSITGKYYCSDTTTGCGADPYPPDPCKSSFVPGSCSGTRTNCLPTYSSPAQCVSPATPTPTVRVSGIIVTGTPSNIVALQPCNPAPFGGANQGIQTGLGCVPTTISGIFPWFLKLIVLVAGGIALLIIMYGGIMFITAGGDAKAVDEAKGMITAGVSGLLLIVFSVLIFRVIGVNILGIPVLSVNGVPNGGINVPGNY